MFILDIDEEQHVEIQRNIMDKIQEDIQMMYSQMIMRHEYVAVLKRLMRSQPSGS
jgi:disulfide oxidoreductase YuzD